MTTETTLPRPARTGPFAGLPRPFWILFYGSLVNRIGGVVSGFLVLYLTAIGIPLEQVGLVLAAKGVGALISQPVGGVLTDLAWASEATGIRIGGRRFTLVLGLLASAACLTFLGAAQGLPMLVTAAFLHGVVADIFRPAAAALIADVVERPLLTKAYGLQFWAINLGFSVASVMAGHLADSGYWLLFALNATGCTAFAIIVWLGIPRSAERVVKSTVDGPKFGMRELFRDRLLLGVVLLVLAHATVYSQAEVIIPLAVKDSGLGAAGYGTIIAVNGVLIVILQPLAAAWVARFDRMRVLALAWAVVGAGMALTGLAETALEYVLTVIVWTLGEIAMAGLLGSLAADLAPPAARGRYQAAIGFGFSAAAFTGPLLGTWVYQHGGPAAAWFGCLALGLLGAAGALAIGPAIRRRTALAAG
ncbi:MULTISPECIES: MFS transporter [unclassified Crossiella]|uniref:MFS transporter n=1 Tax=unclassified Crossiella TaxID=2620835 RepID=UPI00200008C2|nr:MULTISPECIES: MFS transporter [unclassified Crossiella]MCK2239893.1 MFS transporter [Crossiella sp. S99.2]MCK2252601.1 MFS transporter [Crossiella sp. S99.1]